jgi:glycosyltransferase involved in cell wall biosynthesis
VLSPIHIITCEYPPQLGGVADYTQLVASHLARAGRDIHVWCPHSLGEAPDVPGLCVHREAHPFSPGGLNALSRALDGYPSPRRLLVQWVPHGFGYRSMNVAFCAWLWKRSQVNGDRIALMVHEPYLSFEGSWKQYGAAMVHRLMTTILLRASDEVFVAIPAWEKYLRPYAFGRRASFMWSPVPSNVPPLEQTPLRLPLADANRIRIGHFGTDPPQIANVLSSVIPEILNAEAGADVLLLGPKSHTLRTRITGEWPELQSRVLAAGPLHSDELSRHLSSCDIMLQPYPDGVSTRRSSIMAQLQMGLPVVTTTGPLTEPLWAGSGAVILSRVAELAQNVLELIHNSAERVRLGRSALELYDRYFHIRHTVARLVELT